MVTSVDEEIVEIRKVAQRAAARVRAGSEHFIRLAADGTFDPPCHADCDGLISFDGRFGRCPVQETFSGCVIPDREREDAIEALLSMGWVESYLRESTWDKCRVSTELQAIPDRAGLLITGPPGTGKTSACALLALKRYPFPWGYAYWPDLIDGIDGSEFDRFKRMPGLVVDDWGVGDVPEWKAHKLDSFWEFRNSRRLRTIVTSNATLDQIRRLGGQSRRYVDRWRQMMPHSLVIGGESQR